MGHLQTSEAPAAGGSASLLQVMFCGHGGSSPCAPLDDADGVRVVVTGGECMSPMAATLSVASGGRGAGLTDASLGLFPGGGDEIVEVLGAPPLLEAHEDVSEVLGGLDVENGTSSHQGEQRSVPGCGFVGADEQPVVLAERLAAKLGLLERVADRPGTVAQVGLKVRLATQHRGGRAANATLGGGNSLQRLQLGDQKVEERTARRVPQRLDLLRREALALRLPLDAVQALNAAEYDACAGIAVEPERLFK